MKLSSVFQCDVGVQGNNEGGRACFPLCLVGLKNFIISLFNGPKLHRCKKYFYFNGNGIASCLLVISQIAANGCLKKDRRRLLNETCVSRDIEKLVPAGKSEPVHFML